MIGGLNDKKSELLSSRYDFQDGDESYVCGFSDGFDEAIKLNLPVLFSEWQNSECYYNIKGWCMYDMDDSPEFQIDELYNYWIENVYNKSE